MGQSVGASAPGSCRANVTGSSPIRYLYPHREPSTETVHSNITCIGPPPLTYGDKHNEEKQTGTIILII